jgi:hypothetical protein
VAEPSEAARLRRLFEGMMGQALGNADVGEMRRVLREAGLPVDDPAQVDELERRWQELQPAVLQAAVDPEVDAFLVVDPVFQAAMERLGERATDPRALAAEAAGIRAIVTTRIVDGVVDNGGWITMLTGSAEIVPVAIDGYRLIGLDEHASLAVRAYERGFVKPGPDDDEHDDPEIGAFWDELHEAWYELPSAEVARATYIGANPDIR